VGKGGYQESVRPSWLDS